MQVEGTGEVVLMAAEEVATGRWAAVEGDSVVVTAEKAVKKVEEVSEVAREAAKEADSVEVANVAVVKVAAAMEEVQEVVTAAVKEVAAWVEETAAAAKVETAAAAKEAAAMEAGREEETEMDSAVEKEAAKAVVDLEMVDLEEVMEKAKEEARGEDWVAGSEKAKAENLEEATAGAEVADAAVAVEGEL